MKEKSNIIVIDVVLILRNRLTLKIILHQSMKEKRLILKIRKVNNARKSLDFLVEKSSESSHEHAVK